MARRSRRGILHPKKLLREFRTHQSGEKDFGEPATEADIEKREKERAEKFVAHVTKQAMACQFEVIMNAGTESEFTEAAIDGLELVTELESQMTVYRNSSIISAINARAGKEPLLVEKRLLGLLQQAKEICNKTDGAFDITTGPLTKAWGFFKRDGKFPEPEDLKAALEKVGSQYLHIDLKNSTAELTHSDAEINLGAIGKGYALDRCASLLRDRMMQNFLLHGGLSSVFASGARAGIEKDGGSGWSVGIRHPVKDQRILEVFLNDCALGTSGTGRQGFFHEGKRYGHILDPRTGFPADSVFSSTVIAPTAAEADAYATAFYINGPDWVQTFCDANAEIKAILIVPRDKEKPMNGLVDVHGFNLEENDFRFV